MSTPDPESIDPKKLRPGPIRNESLSPELIEQISAVYDVIGPYVSTSLEQFEIGFMRDMHPENEALIWARITAGWIDSQQQPLDDERLPDEEEKKLLAALIAISTGVDDAKKLGVPVEVGRKLLACYDAHGEELE